MMLPKVLRLTGVPDRLRLRAYGHKFAKALELQKISETAQLPELLMEDGKTSKLASWRFINKDDTVLCEPADYLAYALLQHARDKNSLKSRWVYPIISATPGGFAGLVQREHASGVILGQKKEKIIQMLEDVKQLIKNEEAKRLKSEDATE